MAPNIEISDLSFSFGSRAPCLNDVSLSVNESELCCLLGPNGAGKTTLIRCLLGLLEPETGSMQVAGQDVANLSPRQLARLVAYVPQFTSTVFPFTALEMVVMGRTPHVGMVSAPSRGDRTMARSTLDRLGIAHLAPRPFSQLSGGERQLVMLGRSLAQEARVLVLDEPTAALDFGNEVRILQVVNDLVAAGPTVLMTTHQPNHALTWADQAVLMREGSVVLSGPPGEVVTAEHLSSLYDIPVRVSRSTSGAADEDEQLFCFPEVISPRRRRGPGRLPIAP
jgi:iron complex transport system ATP-binding protein